jgi:hypothetical protein
MNTGNAHAAKRVKEVKVPLIAGMIANATVHRNKSLPKRQIIGIVPSTRRKTHRSRNDPAKACHSVGLKNPATNFGRFHRFPIE